jgi:hypothetical protein
VIGYEESDDLGINDPWTPVTLFEELQGVATDGVQQVKAIRFIPADKQRVFIRLVATPVP